MSIAFYNHASATVREARSFMEKHSEAVKGLLPYLYVSTPRADVDDVNAWIDNYLKDYNRHLNDLEGVVESLSIDERCEIEEHPMHTTGIGGDEAYLLLIRKVLDIVLTYKTMEAANIHLLALRNGSPRPDITPELTEGSEGLWNRLDAIYQFFRTQLTELDRLRNSAEKGTEPNKTRVVIPSLRRQLMVQTNEIQKITAEIRDRVMNRENRNYKDVQIVLNFRVRVFSIRNRMNNLAREIRGL